jgi:kynurenine formamidase
MSVRLIEIGHVIERGMKTYPGLPEPRVEVVVDYDASRAAYNQQAELFIASLHLCGNTGTYVDAPVHRHRHGQDLAALPLERLAPLDTLCLDVRGAWPTRAIEPQWLDGLDVGDEAVLVYTGWSDRWRTERHFEPNPFLPGTPASGWCPRGPAPWASTR